MRLSAVCIRCGVTMYILLERKPTMCHHCRNDSLNKSTMMTALLKVREHFSSGKGKRRKIAAYSVMESDSRHWHRYTLANPTQLWHKVATATGGHGTTAGKLKYCVTNTALFKLPKASKMKNLKMILVPIRSTLTGQFTCSLINAGR